MREDSQVSELLCALRRQGVWGSRAAALARDWVEHVREDTAQRVERGADPSVAQAAAWRALGTPEDLALHAAREFARGSWFGRHPWVAGLVLPILMWVLLTVVLFLGCAWSLGVFTDSHDQAWSVVEVGWWPRVFNWLPWLVSLSWFVWMTVRMPGGWRLSDAGPGKRPMFFAILWAGGAADRGDRSDGFGAVCWAVVRCRFRGRCMAPVCAPARSGTCGAFLAGDLGSDG